MFLDHPAISATNGLTEPDRIQRLERVYGYALALSDAGGNEAFVHKLTQLHDHKGTLIMFWNEAPTDAERAVFAHAWASKIGDGNCNVEHEF